VRRARAAWKALAPEQRLAGFAALALFGTMFLPWYEKSVAFRGRFVRDTLTAFGAFSFVEAAVLLVAGGVLALLFARGERRAFHLPGGDGVVILAAGTWAALLIVWRFFDKPDLSGKAAGATVGLEWGIFVALGAAIGLALAGNRVRAARRPEPPLHPAPPEPPPGAPVQVHVPAERPHLAETRVLPERRPAPPGREAQTPGARRPLSRDAARQELASQQEEEPHTEPLSPPSPPPEDEPEDGEQPRLPGI
jgi:hypothetical protein